MNNDENDHYPGNIKRMKRGIDLLNNLKELAEEGHLDELIKDCTTIHDGLAVQQKLLGPFCVDSSMSLVLEVDMVMRELSVFSKQLITSLGEPEELLHYATWLASRVSQLTGDCKSDR